jgi:hypothetical protein
MQKPFFDYATAARQALEASAMAGGKDGDKDNKGGKDKPRTLMVGEAPGEDLGYDPKSIPTEPIPPEDDDAEDDADDADSGQD